MATERLIKDLVDLREAAARREVEAYDVTDPDERDVVLSCLEPGGKVYSSEEAREELKRRLASRGISHGEQTR